jgi:hypothetical protein
MAKPAKIAPQEVQPSAEARATRRKIPGSMPYTGSAGVLQRVLDKIPISEKPSIFTQDFLSTVLGVSGGASRPIIPILKSCGLISQGGSPTELYAQFQTEGGRAAAALDALRKGYPEIFKRNQYAHRADEKTLVDVIIAITGLPRGEKIVRYILNTFQTFQSFAKSANDEAKKVDIQPPPAIEGRSAEHVDSFNRQNIGLTYNINIVLPETTNIEVYNTIFISLKNNMLK